MPAHDVISFLSDYGTTDEFVGVCHSVIAEMAPHARIVDLTHGIAPFDVRAGSLALARSVQYVHPGVVMAVVDPGVGTDRKGVAVEVLDGRAVFVGPDNGLLAPAVAMVGGATRAVHLTSEVHRLAAPGATFDGRDVFSPAAAHLANGVDLAELGDLIDPALLLPSLVPVPREDGDALICEVLWVDRYGNCQLNVGPEEVAVWGDTIMTSWSGETRAAKVAAAFAELAAGQIGLVVDSYGVLALALDQRSAAGELGIATGDEVTLRAPTGEEPVREPVPVTIR